MIWCFDHVAGGSVLAVIVKVYCLHGRKILKIEVQKPKLSPLLKINIGDFGWKEDTPSLIHGCFYSALTISVRKDMLSSQP
jgi:hypothetical protein